MRQQVTFSVLVGNADLHGKNVSFLHHPGGTVSLTPIYDVMCTTCYDGASGSRHVGTALGLFIGDHTAGLRVGIRDVVAESQRWGVRGPVARATIGVHVPEDIVERVIARTLSFS